VRVRRRRSTNTSTRGERRERREGVQQERVGERRVSDGDNMEEVGWSEQDTAPRNNSTNGTTAEVKRWEVEVDMEGEGAPSAQWGDEWGCGHQ
jgi:hypothetical protein